MKAKLIINPSSGKQLVQRQLDRIVGNLVLNGTLKSIDIAVTQKKDDATNEAMSMKEGEYDVVIAVGGDGTLNEVVNGVILGANKTPIAILPAGTVNDFANWIGSPFNQRSFCEMIKNNKKIPVDVGKVGGKYFINVAAGGLLTDVGYKVSTDAKTVLGKFAYILEGIREIPKQMFKSFNLEINAQELQEKDEILLFIVTNTPSVGGFKKLAPKATVNDGLLDVCIIKKADIAEVFSLFLSTMRGEHVNHPKVEYIQTSKIEFKCSDDLGVDLDLDGEYGGKLPASFEVVPSAVEIFIP